MADINDFKYENVLNSRHLIAELNSLRETIMDEYNSHFDLYGGDEEEMDFDTLSPASQKQALDLLDEVDRELYVALVEVNDEAPGEEWTYGATMISEHYFEDYARELAKDLGAIGKDTQWPLTYIDWEAAADALKVDYSTVEFLGTTWYIR